MAGTTGNPPKGKETTNKGAVTPVGNGQLEAVKKDEKETSVVRFTKAVTKLFTESIGKPDLTKAQERLIQNYFIATNTALQVQEEKRKRKVAAKAKGADDILPYTWDHVNMTELAQIVVSCARMGLDPAMDNHINLIPFKDNTLNLYTVTPIKGYRGMQIIATKYGLDKENPDNVIVELVYSTDNFKIIKKDRSNKIETYDFEVTSPFARGEIEGGFYYHEFIDKPEKNKIVFFPLKDILKRKPQYASTEFWGGEKVTKWKEGKPIETEVIEGWYETMCWKTVFRAAFKNIPIDSQKIDIDFMNMKKSEDDYMLSMIDQEIDEEGNKHDLIEAEYTTEDDDTPTEPAKDSGQVEGEQAKIGDGPGWA